MFAKIPVYGVSSFKKRVIAIFQVFLNVGLYCLLKCLFILFVCFDSLGPSQQSGLTSAKQNMKCPAQGHNAVFPVRLKPTTPGS